MITKLVYVPICGPQNTYWEENLPSEDAWNRLEPLHRANCALAQLIVASTLSCSGASVFVYSLH